MRLKKLASKLLVAAMMLSVAGPVSVVNAQEPEEPVSEVASLEAGATKENEPNDTKETATPLDINVSCSGEIGSYAKWEKDGLDEDWYSFSLTAGQTYQLWMEDYLGEFNETTLLLILFNTEGKETSVRHEMRDTGVNYYEFTAQKSGTYYFQIYNYFDTETETEHYYTVSIRNDGQAPEAELPVGKFASFNGFDFYRDESGDVRAYNSATGAMLTNDFQCDGTYTYYFQADGTAMKDRLTYHPDGIHVIYFDKYGHEVFSNFANVKKSISGDAVDDMCFFNVYGYMYVDTLTYDKTGTKLYYVNPYGVLERTGWFAFSGNEFDAGLGFSGRAGGYGYANSDCSLVTNTYTYDWDGNYVYIQGDGHMFR